MSRRLLSALPLLLLAVVFITLHRLSDRQKAATSPSPHRSSAADEQAEKASALRTKSKAFAARIFIAQKNFSTRIVFLLDMRLPSGRKRFFVYDLKGDSVLASGLVAHGSCNRRFLTAAQFSNTVGCGCSAEGRYRVGGVYNGRFGKAFKLHGLDSTNGNAFKRNIVLHAYGCVPDEECYPVPICNSLGCTMVSYNFLAVAASFIKKERKPLVLWLYN